MNSKRIELNPIQILLELFELTGESMVGFYDFVIEFPELINREAKKKDGMLQQLINLVRKNVLSQKQLQSSQNNFVVTSKCISDLNSNETCINIDHQQNSISNNNNNNTTFIISDCNTSSPLLPSSITTPSITTIPHINTVQPQQQTTNNSLEDELTRLREQIAKIMQSSATAPQNCNIPTNNNNTPITSNLPPPPPPPPLPPKFVPKEIKLNIKRGSNSSNNSSNSTPETSTPKKSMSIQDILKNGAKGITLKKSDVNRSPGGTPIRDITNKQTSHQDFIATALKNKFRNTYASPEKPKVKTNLKKKQQSIEDSLFSDSDDEYRDENALTN
ncbi:hypothetical protein DLAC_05139 [Tieghemostelium lacteum]|uniref:Uncharacterized protein n=1 Tax=Tieghemostelium lacteum TaxID=361077 RepID=A0A151ZIM7_TIELA|nr:hypothetical protein DLAC_05139 [Tieghemostelium lacteum]|eukprot:KYQ93749.1 hypothetical protein DLAC_05139 [Tieghemostelium lacteum]